MTDRLLHINVIGGFQAHSPHLVQRILTFIGYRRSFKGTFDFGVRQFNDRIVEDELCVFRNEKAVGISPEFNLHHLIARSVAVNLRAKPARELRVKTSHL